MNITGRNVILRDDYMVDYYSMDAVCADLSLKCDIRNVREIWVDFPLMGSHMLSFICETFSVSISVATSVVWVVEK